MRHYRLASELWRRSRAAAFSWWLRRLAMCVPLAAWMMAHAAAPLPTPTIISAIPGISQVTLRWNPVDGATTYYVYVSSTKGVQGAVIKPGTSDTEYTAHGLSPKQPYVFTLIAVSKAAVSAPAAQVGPLQVGADLARPLDLAALVGSTVTLTWTTIGADSYEIDKGTDPSGVPSQSVDVVASASTATQTYTVPSAGLKSGVPYFFVVHAITLGKPGPASNEVSAELASAAATKTTAEPPLAFFETGVSLLNPYHISTTAPVSISPATSTDANALLEFTYTDRIAWSQSRLTKFLGDNPQITEKPVWLKVWDVQATVAYTFTNGQAATANTIVGSGNFNGEISVGIPFRLYRAPDDSTDWTLSPVFGYSAVTDRNALSSHQSISTGIAYDTALQDPLGSKDANNNIRRILLDFRLLGAAVDSIRYVSPSSTAIETIHGTLPDYHWKPTEAFETELMYPVNQATWVTFEGRIYPSLTPGLWSIQLGLSMSLSDLVKTFFK